MIRAIMAASLGLATLVWDTESHSSCPEPVECACSLQSLDEPGPRTVEVPTNLRLAVSPEKSFDLPLELRLSQVEVAPDGTFEHVREVPLSFAEFANGSAFWATPDEILIEGASYALEDWTAPARPTMILKAVASDFVPPTLGRIVEDDSTRRFNCGETTILTLPDLGDDRTPVDDIVIELSVQTSDGTSVFVTRSMWYSLNYLAGPCAFALGPGTEVGVTAVVTVYDLAGNATVSEPFQIKPKATEFLEVECKGLFCSGAADGSPALRLWLGLAVVTLIVRTRRLRPSPLSS